MQLTERTPLGAVVAKHPRAAAVFEKYQIDYCCGGDRPLGEACTAAGVAAGTVIEEIRRADAESSHDRDWMKAPLAEVIDHILVVHHGYLRAELPVLDVRIAKVAEAHRERHAKRLGELGSVFTALSDELDAHLRKEEAVLFPAIRQFEQARETGAARPVLPFGSLRNPIRVMEREHQSAGRALAEIRRLTDDYRVPADGCATFRALYEGLSQLEMDLHRHIHLENNILFPRAGGLEASFR